MKLEQSESTLASYRLERVTTDEPGFLTIYEGTMASNGDRVSVRAFPIPGERRAKVSFRRAAKERAASSHPGLAPARDVLERDDRLYIVTEATTASTLRARLAKARLEPRAAVQALEQVAAALDGLEWVQDAILSTTDILLAPGPDGPRGSLLDPAKAVSLKEAGWPWVHPYPEYSPPELGSGEHLGGRTMVYSLGCILFESVSGSLPFEGDWLAIVEAHSAQPVPRVDERLPELGPALSDVIARAMAKDPAERFASAGELMRAAATALEQSATAATEALDQLAPGTLEREVESSTKPDAVSRNGDEAPLAEPLAGARRPGASRRARTRRPSTAAILAGVVAIACAPAGYLVGEAAAPSGERAPIATAGPLSLELPADWRRLPTARGVLPGDPLEDPLAAAPVKSGNAGIIAGRIEPAGIEPAGRDFLPSGLEAQRGYPVEPVRLGRYEAYRHRGLRADGSRRQITAYSVPTTTLGSAVLACHAAPDASRRFMDRCERVASTLKLHGLRALSLSDLITWRRRLAVTIAELERQRSAGRRRLAAARTPAAQARHARSLETGYAGARRSLAGLDPAVGRPGWHERTQAAVRRVERAYGLLASAARRGSRSGYDKARLSVSRAEAALARLLAGASSPR